MRAALPTRSDRGPAEMCPMDRPGAKHIARYTLEGEC